jgi:hypothetical protein
MRQRCQKAFVIRRPLHSLHLNEPSSAFLAWRVRRRSERNSNPFSECHCMNRKLEDKKTQQKPVNCRHRIEANLPHETINPWIRLMAKSNCSKPVRPLKCQLTFLRCDLARHFLGEQRLHALTRFAFQVSAWSERFSSRASKVSIPRLDSKSRFTRVKWAVNRSPTGFVEKSSYENYHDIRVNFHTKSMKKQLLTKSSSETTKW